MKVTATERQRSGNILGVKRDSRSCIMKAAAATSIEYAGLSEEMNVSRHSIIDLFKLISRVRISQ